MLENPLRFKLWVHASMQATASMIGVIDACVWGKRRPDTGELIKKPIMVIGTPEVVSAVDVRCAGGHDHCVVEGAMHCPTSDGQWNRKVVSDWAGGHTAEFSVALLKGVHDAVATRSVPRPLYQSFPASVHPEPSV